MSNISLEYYYLSGKNIPLNNYNLGIIKQLTLNEFIDLNADINEFVQPFLLDKKILLNNDKNIDEILNNIKDLSFLFLYEQLTNYPILNNLLKSLTMIYETDDIYIDKDNVTIVVNNGINDTRCIIDDENFHILSTVICEMVGVEKPKNQQVKLNKEMTEIESEFERRRQKYLQMQQGNKAKKNEGYTILDIANIVIHFSSFTYNDVFNMTIYQLKNSFKVLAKKDSYMVNLLHRISQKFDTSKEKFVHWTDEAKLDISSLSLKD